ncbi:methyl-accepting chemotaxis protein [Dyella flava]|uniref:MCP four helix bundle domain-containing protein n=1 Tax=Dyella flava TaxID=1920170 RepID=A0ABS2K4W5_9GAMM|nr:methyl-accepting chemotaxis protein [Dyella flava]MBM7126273.1 MCP four helix bundle domain-containing protein [Dyella flava]GLQ48923.1 methyl-accepting chemotaxis protein [Dyella flava]
MKLRFPNLKFFSLTIKARLIVLVGLLCFMLVAGAVIGLGSMARQNAGTQAIYDNELVPTQLTDTLRTSSLKYFIALNEAANLIGKADQLKQKMTEVARYQKEIDDVTDALQKRSAMLSPKLMAVVKDYRSSDKDYAQARDDVLDAIKQNDNSATDLIEMEMRPLLMQRQDALSKVVDTERQEAQQIYQDQVTSYEHVRLITVIALLAGLLFALLRSALLIRSISHALNYAMKVAKEIAGGKLGHEIEVKGADELANLLSALRTMDQRLVEIVAEVRQGSDAVSTAAQQIARGNDDLSQRTQEQASSLEETASSMEEMTSTVKQNAENASHANQLARGAREQAERGGEVVAQAVTAMREINSSSRKISDIVSLIDEIAFQTNLLALNAAVEAARAGEQGRGFAVVATEVRNLAQRSAGAAKEIKLLINDSNDKVRTGTDLVDQSGKALADIVDSVKKVTDIVAEIAAASQEQSAGIDQVNNAVAQMDEMTQQNAALVEEASAAARAMHEQSSELSRQVSFFRFGDDAVVAAAPAKPKAAEIMAETEAVFAAVRQSAPAARRNVPETADSGVWKEF